MRAAVIGLAAFVVGWVWGSRHTGRLLEAIFILRERLRTAERDPAHERCFEVERRLSADIDDLIAERATEFADQAEQYLKDGGS